MPGGHASFPSQDPASPTRAFRAQNGFAGRRWRRHRLGVTPSRGTAGGTGMGADDLGRPRHRVDPPGRSCVDMPATPATRFAGYQGDGGAGRSEPFRAQTDTWGRRLRAPITALRHTLRGTAGARNRRGSSSAEPRPHHPRRPHPRTYTRPPSPTRAGIRAMMETLPCCVYAQVAHGA
jgi:hypothetical protein